MKKAIGYMCGTDFNTELPSGGPAVVYPTIKVLKANADCWKECGIVKVKINWDKVIKKAKI